MATVWIFLLSHKEIKESISLMSQKDQTDSEVLLQYKYNSNQCFKLIQKTKSIWSDAFCWIIESNWIFILKYVCIFVWFNLVLPKSKHLRIAQNTPNNIKARIVEKWRKKQDGWPSNLNKNTVGLNILWYVFDISVKLLKICTPN